jgi:hypothetical protein
MNLDSADATFRMVSETIGDQIARVPDGETTTKRWLSVQGPRMNVNPALTPASSENKMFSEMPAWQLREGVDARDVVFDFGYAERAEGSYPIFREMKESGAIAPEVRFQVGLPTPIAIGILIARRDQRALLPAIERALFGEIDRIARTIPLEELAIQWEVAIEIAALQGLLQVVPDTEEMLDQLVRVADGVPASAEVGFHLCFGDSPPRDGGAGERFAQADLGLLVDIASRITAARRPIQWLHMPVPIDREDDAYFEPLERLNTGPGTTLFLGLIHEEDGVEGAQRRIAAAARHRRDFGVATECGMGRKPTNSIRRLLEIHRDAVVPDET